MEICPSKEEDMPAAERKINLAVLLELCCVLKDEMCRLGTTQEPLVEKKSRNGNTACPPPTKPRTLAQGSNYPEECCLF